MRFFSILFFASVLVGCGLTEFRDQERKLQVLVEKRASKGELVQVLGTNYLTYSRTTNWQHLINYLNSEPQDRLIGVRKGIRQWPTVLQYSTPDMMTWVFLDEEERVAGFVVGAQ